MRQGFWRRLLSVYLICNFGVLRWLASEYYDTPSAIVAFDLNDIEKFVPTTTTLDDDDFMQLL